MNTSDAKKHGTLVVQMIHSHKASDHTRVARVTVPFGMGDDLYNLLSQQVPDKMQSAWYLASAITVQTHRGRDTLALINDDAPAVSLYVTCDVPVNADDSEAPLDASCVEESYWFFISVPTRELLASLVLCAPRALSPVSAKL